jgi:hypothetical protein
MRRRRRPRREVEALTKGSSRSVAAFLRQDRAPLSWKNDGAEKGAASEDHEGEEVIPTSSSAATRCVDLLRSLAAPVAPESGNCGRSSPNSRQSHRARASADATTARLQDQPSTGATGRSARMIQRLGLGRPPRRARCPSVATGCAVDGRANRGAIPPNRSSRSSPKRCSRVVDQLILHAVTGSR